MVVVILRRFRPDMPTSISKGKKPLSNGMRFLVRFHFFLADELREVTRKAEKTGHCTVNWAKMFPLIEMNPPFPHVACLHYGRGHLKEENLLHRCHFRNKRRKETKCNGNIKKTNGLQGKLEKAEKNRCSCRISSLRKCQREKVIKKVSLHCQHQFMVKLFFWHLAFGPNFMLYLFSLSFNVKG